MQLVLLAAGHGTRFGGLKQLAEVGPEGQAIMDYTAADALAAGFDGVVLVVREDVRDELLAHVARKWPGELAVEPVTQGPVAGTAQAVASAASAIDGPFAVANADDLYGADALFLLAEHEPALAERTHLIVGYRLADTVLSDDTVTRGICEISADGDLVRVVEQSVTRKAEGFTGVPVEGRGAGGARLSGGEDLTGAEVVSMNLWGFAKDIFGDLEEQVALFDPATPPRSPGKPPELLLPSVVGALVERGRARVLVRPTTGRCIGITHPDDLARVRRLVASSRHGQRA